MNTTRQPIGYVEATVRFPIYEGDNLESAWDDFVYDEPGITTDGQLSTCTRQCQTLEAHVVQTRKEA